MATTISVKITNLAEIKAAFAKAPSLMAKNLDTAIRKAALTIQRESMINTPVLTGRLRSSHQSTFRPLKGIIDVTADYAPYVHWGTRYMKARPFLLNAVNAEERNVNDLFGKAVQDTLDEIARGV